LRVEKLPSALLIHGDSDGAIGPYQSLTFARALGRIRARVVIVPGGQHTGPTMLRPELDAALHAFAREVAEA
jgi:dipeptidyl aminopeptidase/acylaminoacyl peptidase